MYFYCLWYGFVILTLIIDKNVSRIHLFPERHVSQLVYLILTPPPPQLCVQTDQFCHSPIWQSWAQGTMQTRDLGGTIVVFRYNAEIEKKIYKQKTGEGTKRTCDLGGTIIVFRCNTVNITKKDYKSEMEKVRYEQLNTWWHLTKSRVFK